MVHAMKATIAGLRVEAAAFLLLSVFAYHLSGFSWLLFGVLFLAPDLSMVGYLFDSRRGALIYNIVHNYAAPVAVGVLGHLTKNETLVAIGLIWAAHISMDRAVGYGLKLPSDFRDTHLGRIGKS